MATEFHGTNSKISRYSTIITELHNLKTWWSSLSTQEQMTFPNIERLVLTGEDILAEERAAWASECKSARFLHHNELRLRQQRGFDVHQADTVEQLEELSSIHEKSL